MNMTTNLEKIKELRLRPILRVSQRGKGLYLYLPKTVVEVSEIRPGDRIEVDLRAVYRPQPNHVERPM